MNGEFESYLSFRENLSAEISRLLNEAEEYLHDFEKTDIEAGRKGALLERKIAETLTITSTLNIFEGREYLQNLHSLVEEKLLEFRKKRAEFNTMNFLINRSSVTHERSLENAPKTRHFQEKEHAEKNEFENYKLRGYQQYLSFMRNGSWFLVRCKDTEIYNFIKADIDPLKDKRSKTPRLSIDSGEKVYAADKTGRRFFASRGCIERLVTPFSFHSHIARGYVRLFGIRHIFLR